MPKPTWVYTDFNGLLEPGLLCLAHSDVVTDVSGQKIELYEGMAVIAYDDDADDFGRPDAIFAAGTVERSPEYARCQGSKWSLRIDSAGIRHESEIGPDARV